MANFKRFDGTNNVDPTFVRRWDGTNFVDVSFVRRFDGTNWIDVWPLTDLTPNAITFSTMHAGYTAVNGSSSTPNYVYSGNYVVSGISAPINIRFAATSPISTGGGFLYVRKNGGSWTNIITAPVGGAGTAANPVISFSNGDNMSFQLGVNGQPASQLNPYTSGEWSVALTVQNNSQGNATIGVLNGTGYMSDSWGNDDGGGGIILP